MSASTPANLPPLATLRPWLDRFAGLRLVVWGDVVADRFLYGSTTRVSREAPALVIRHESEEVRPGGAGNVMMNCAALGARVAARGWVGVDSPGDRLRDALADAGVEVEGLGCRDDGSTPVKTRVMAGGVHTVRQQVLRIDREEPWVPADAARREVLGFLEGDVDAGLDALLISDYGLGSVDPGAWERLSGRLRERRVPVFLDSRSAMLSFPGVTAATPNEGEVQEALHERLDGTEATLERLGERLRRRLDASTLLVTRGSCGMSLFETGAGVLHLPIHGSDEIADVTGAGDAVIAAFALAAVAGAPHRDAARIANVAGALAVNKRGTVPVSAGELGSELEDDR